MEMVLKHRCERGFMGIEGVGVYLFYLIMTVVALACVAMLFGGSKLTEMESAVSVIRMNTQQMFTSSMDYVGLNNDIAMKAGLVPKKLIKGGALTNSWGGTLTLAEGDDTSTFTITMTEVPQDACSKLATYQAENWLSIEVNSTVIGKEVAVVEAANNCQESNTIVYTAR